MRHTVWAYVGGPKNWGVRAPVPWDIKPYMTPLKHAPPHICYCAKFGRSLGQTIRANVRMYGMV